MVNPPLEISVLGKPLLNWQGQPLTAEQVSSKGLALLVYLAMGGRPCSRQAVSGLLWGDLPEQRARQPAFYAQQTARSSWRRLARRPCFA